MLEALRSVKKGDVRFYVRVGFEVIRALSVIGAPTYFIDRARRASATPR